MIQIRKKPEDRICQGDIFRDVEYLESFKEDAGNIQVNIVVFPLVIVLTQDCDLEQDYRFRGLLSTKPKTQDKQLFSVLVAPLYNEEHIYTGEHLSELGMTMEPINRNKTPGDFLRKNERPRYHKLSFPPNVPVVDSIIDFKHYFSLSVTYLLDLKRTNFMCSVSDLYREDISQRFASYLSRIGLPDPQN